MEAEELLLSICMIVKNEEVYLRRCMEALKPILEQVDSELIIVDTGSTDGTVAIAREFTDKIYSFEWCGDFSAARNATLKNARGAWIMSVDSDEIFELSQPLIDFFSSGECKSYNSATFVQRNYSDKALKCYTDFNAPRITLRKKNTEYVGIIHERLTTFAEPVKMLPAIAGHHGYITVGNEEFVKRKAKRNLELLFDQLEDNQKDYFCLFNICQTYLLEKNYECALTYCDSALRSAKEQGKFIMYSIYFSKAGIYYQTGRFSDALDTIEDYFCAKGNEKAVLATDLEMHFLKAECSFRLKRYQAGWFSFREYIKLYREYNRGMHRTLDTMQHSINFIDESSYRHAISTMIDSYIAVGNYASAYAETEAVFSELSDTSGGKNGLAELYELTSDAYRELLRCIIEKLLENETCRKDILSDFSTRTEPYSDYTGLMKLRYMYDCNTLTTENVLDFFERVGDVEPIYADAVYYSLKLSAPFEVLARKVDAYSLDTCLFGSPFLHYSDLPEIIYGLSARSEEGGSDLFSAFLFRWALNSDKHSDDRSMELFLAYSGSIYSFLINTFREEILTEEMSYLIPKQLRAGFFCHMAVESLNMNRTALGLKYLKLALELDNGLKGIVKTLHDKIKQQNDELQAKKEQFDRYAASVKAALKALIKNRDYGNAAKILAAYEALCPEDTEISEFKALIK